MSVYLEDPDVTLLLGDVVECLRTLPDESVHMCVTSPPFYGLRDYGTGRWEGGGADCDHAIGTDRQDAGRTSETFHGGHATSTRYAGRECPKCGARRVDQQIGLEETPEEWVERLVAVFRGVRRVLRRDGTLWVEVGDSYGANTQGSPKPSADTKGHVDGHIPNAWGGGQATAIKHPSKPKDLIGAPWLLAFALRADGWYLRSEIIWSKPNPMPESVTDRPTTAHSRIFLLTKSPRYFFDAEAVREPTEARPQRRLTPLSEQPKAKAREAAGVAQGNPQGGVSSNRNVRSVWEIATQPFPEAHFATFPEALVRRCILAGSSERGCCPACGAPWVREVEKEATGRWVNGRGGIGEGASRESHGLGAVNREGFRTGVVYHTTGWQPSCGCVSVTTAPHWMNEQGLPGVESLAPVPCTILDPFVGSGTTCFVARKLGRRAIGVDLSEDYLRMASRRLAQQSLFSEVVSE